MPLNIYEQAIVRNADWFISMEDERGFIQVPADEYYGVPGDASLIGHAMSIRTYAWVLTGRDEYLESARRSARWLADRQDERGGWYRQAGYSLDAAQCVMEGYCTYERLTGDRQFHATLIRAADRMIEGTVAPNGNLYIGNLTECGEYAHHSFMAWKQTGLDRHKRGGETILATIMNNFDEDQGYWNTALDPEVSPLVTLFRPLVNPILRASIAAFDFKGKTVAKISEKMLPLVMRGRGPQYSLGMMCAESLLDMLDGSLEFPGYRDQVGQALEWVRKNCAGPGPGSVAESRDVPQSQAVYPLKAINDAENSSLWPTAVTLLGMVGMNDPKTYGERASETADWLVSMQDDDGGFFVHQDPRLNRFGGKYGNINYYGSTGLWYYNAIYIRGKEPTGQG